MKALAGAVIKAEPAADIGTDHAFVPIALISSAAVPYMILSDLREGPLKKAEENLRRAAADPGLYELRLGGGLSVLKDGEVSSVIIAGMGGESIRDILAESIEKSRSFKRLILQPRKRSWLLRSWLYDNGFDIKDEQLVRESRKICEIIIAEPAAGPERAGSYDIYLPELMRKEALFKEFLTEYIARLRLVTDNMSNSEYTEDLIKPWRARLEKAERLLNEYI